MPNSVPQHPRWYLIRHAPVINTDHRIYGDADVDCDISMSDYFNKLAAWLPDIDYVCTSHLSRTHRTLEALQKEGLSTPEPEIKTWMGEQKFGQWEGLHFDRLRDTSPSGKDISGFFQFYPSFKPPEGESFYDVVARFASRFQAHHQSLRGKQNRLAIIHAGTIRAALVSCLKIDPQVCQNLVLDNLGVTVLEDIEGIWRCRHINLMIPYE